MRKVTIYLFDRLDYVIVSFYEIRLHMLITPKSPFGSNVDDSLQERNGCTVLPRFPNGDFSVDIT